MYSSKLPHGGNFDEYIQHTINLYIKKDIPKLSPFASRLGVMINQILVELQMSRTNFHGPKDVRAIEG